MDLSVDTLRRLPLALRIEIEENAQRKDLTQTELAEQQEHILAALREHTQQGRRTDLDPTTSAKTFAQVEARATDAVGRIFGESGRQVEKRLAVLKAAREEPEQFGALREAMDRSGRIEAPYRRLRVIQQAEAISSGAAAAAQQRTL